MFLLSFGAASLFQNWGGSKMSRHIERIKSQVVRVALKIFRADPSLGKCKADVLFSEIFARLEAGKTEDEIVSEVCNAMKHRALH